MVDAQLALRDYHSPPLTLKPLRTQPAPQKDASTTTTTRTPEPKPRAIAKPSTAPPMEPAEPAPTPAGLTPKAVPKPSSAPSCASTAPDLAPAMPKAVMLHGPSSTTVPLPKVLLPRGTRSKSSSAPGHWYGHGMLGASPPAEWLGPDRSMAECRVWAPWCKHMSEFWKLRINLVLPILIRAQLPRSRWRGAMCDQTCGLCFALSLRRLRAFMDVPQSAHYMERHATRVSACFA